MRGLDRNTLVSAFQANSQILFCQALNLTYERARRVAEDLGQPVVFLDGKKLQLGAPPSYNTIRKKALKRARRLQRR
jgi:hypothetical protein